MASRLSEHHPSFLEVVGDFTDTYFRVLFDSFSLSSTAVVFLSRSGCGWLLMSPVVSKLLISPSPWFFLLIFFLHPNCLLFSQSQLPRLHPGLCVIIECKTQNAEAMDITIMTHSLLLLSEELMQQGTADHLERPVRQLFQYLCSHTIGRWNSKSADLYSW